MLLENKILFCYNKIGKFLNPKYADDNYAKFWLDPVELSRSIGYNAME